ncbi:MAG: translation initiation factor IF-2 [Clostridia bacterium]|nr:translation initiation factor IF-2 [Clostridia bacterium]
MVEEVVRVRDMAKELGLKSTELLEFLKEYGTQAKNSMSQLSVHDMDVVLEYYTLKFNNAIKAEDFIARGHAQQQKETEAAAPAAAPEEKEAPKAEKESKKATGAPPPPPKKEKKGPVQEKKTVKAERRVDTRASSFDLEKIEAVNKIEEEVAMDHAKGGKERVKQKGPRTQQGAQRTPGQQPKGKMQQGQQGGKNNQNRNQQQGGKNGDKRQKNQPQAAPQPAPKKKQITEIKFSTGITVGELAQKMGVPAADVVKKLFMLGTMATINQELDFDTGALIAEEFGIKSEEIIIRTKEEVLFNDVEDASEDLIPRPPVVVVMGHVDHGKTSLLDTIRHANVTATEAGGITQHIGAYRVYVDGKPITFIDTPGHEAFTAMRARGAQVTDIAILVVAADDGIMPQTVEAINHAKAAGVTIIVAINKIDKEGANPDRIRQQLTDYELIPEEWGGDIVCVEISAKQKLNIDTLLEYVVLQAEMRELKANPNRAAKGTVIESRLDKGRGPVATILVQNGTLHAGDILVAGTTVGRIRVMLDDTGKRIQEAGPSVPVEVVGLSEVPVGGDIFYAVSDERAAREVVEARKQKEKEAAQRPAQKVTLDDLFSQIQEGSVKDLNIIVKADVQGSAEAVKQSLEKLSNEEVRVKVIHNSVGAITESDVMLASASNAIIVGFNVRPMPGVVQTAEQHSIDIRTYRVIYDAIEEIQAAMKGLLAPKFKEVVLGHAEVRQLFSYSSVGTIAGCYVLDGKITRNASVRIVRDGIVVHEGAMDSLKRFKEDAKEVASGYECGITIERFNDIKMGDVFEAYQMVEIAQ